MLSAKPFRIVIAKTRQTVKKIPGRRLTRLAWPQPVSYVRSVIGPSESRLYLLPPSKMGAALSKIG